MPLHYNPSIAEDAVRILNTKMGDHLPNFVSPVIQPIIEIKRFANIARHISSAATGDLTVFTAPTDKDFYISSAGMSIAKDATADIASGIVVLRTTQEGITRDILSITVLTLTAQSTTTTIPFNPAIKPDRGSTILITNANFAAGAMAKSAFITGYTVEVTKGT